MLNYPCNGENQLGKGDRMNKLLVTVGAAVVAATCQAGIKYWDNQDYKAYDANDYVPETIPRNSWTALGRTKPGMLVRSTHIMRRLPTERRSVSPGALLCLA